MIRFHAVLPAIVLSLVLAPSPAGALWYADMAPNGSFELDANRDKVPDEWAPAVFESPAATVWDRDVAHSGSASVRIADSVHPTGTTWRENSGRWVQTSRRPVRSGETYTLSGWVRTELTAGGATLTLAWFGGGRWLHEDATPPATGRTDWTEKRLTAEPPEGAEQVAIYLMLNGGRGTAWFDDVSLTAGEEAPTDLEPLDISSACNAGFTDDVAGDGAGGWTDQGDNDARSIPLGRQNWRGIPFKVMDPARNQGHSCIVLGSRRRPGMPGSAEFTVGRQADVVYFLHGCGWGGTPGTDVARYVVTYADGARETVHLRSGHEIADWWNPHDTEESAAGWRGANPQSRRIGLSIYPWTNPRPETVIARIRMESAGGDPIPILVAVTTGNGPPVLTKEPLMLEVTDTDGWYEWAFALRDHSLGELDLSHLLDPPAGKHGFLTVGADGHFYFEDGTRARFFGTNVGGRRCSPDRETAELIAERLASHGINMLRLHAPDSRWADLIDYESGGTRRLDPEALDRYDYFVAELKKRGIYVYFDLLDYRDFQPADGVRDAADMETRWRHSIKGASIFDERMIELQKEFATQLLTHRNPYTGLRYVDEPALAVQEITNENSLFYLANTSLMLPSYVEDLERRWNRWLLDEYGGRDALARAWTNARGVCALGDNEDPAAGSVALPLGSLYADLRGVPYDDERSPARLNTMTRFLYELEAAYYEQMIAHLRGLGLRCPITGTNQDFSDASNAANALCDFMSRNNYWCHPNVDAEPFMRFDNSAVVRSEMVRRSNPIAEVASSTVAGKPMIVPEFNFPWPNEWRAECLPLMAAYGRLQDWDGLLFFAFSNFDEALSSFGNQSDPVRWGQMPLAALIFLRGDVAVATNTVHVGVSQVGTFSTRPRRGSDRYSPYRVLPWISQIRNVYFDQRYEASADVVVSSGHSSSGDYSAAERAIVFADWPYADELARRANRGHSARQTVPGLQTHPADGPHDTELVEASLPEGAEPIVRDGQTVGFIDATRLIFPSASADGEEDPAWLHRLYLQAAGRWGLPGAAPQDEAGQVFRSDTGELVLRTDPGVFTAAAPCVRMATGFLGEAGSVELGDVSIECATAFASISVAALDGRPVGESARLLLTAVARAENTGQAYLDDHSAIPERGRAPVLAEPVDAVVSLPAARGLTAWALTPTGRRGRELPVQHADGRASVATADAQTPWILLVSE